MGTDGTDQQPATNDDGTAVVGWQVMDADGNVLQQGSGVLLTMDNLADEYTGGQPAEPEES